MDKKTFPEWLITLLILAVACGLSFYLRVALPYQSVFDGQWIKLTSNDAYFYMRMVDNLVQNFPHLYGFDPYGVFPGGFSTANVPAFFAFLLAGIVKILGGTSPSQQTIDTISVYVPAILGILTVIPVYFIGKTLVNRWAGLVAAVALALMPGELLVFSLLGNTDHHSAEVLLTSCFAVFFILAIKRGRQFTYSMLIKGQFPEAGQHLPYALAAGIFLGLYLITWSGALLFVFIIFIYFIIQFISDHLRGFPTDYLSKVAIICFLVALLIFIPMSQDKLTLISLAVVILVPIALNVLSAVMAAREVKRLYYPAIVAGLAVLGIVAAWLLFPALFHSAVVRISSIFSWRLGQDVVGEMKPLFLPGGRFTLDMAWSQYALVLYSGLAGLALVIYRSIRKGQSELIFLAVWSLVTMLASFAMVRFVTYFTVSLVILTGYLAGMIIEACLSIKSADQPAKPRKKAKRNVTAQKPPLRTALVTIAVGIAVIIILIPGAVSAVNSARNPSFMPSNAWMEAMEWMKNNTPEPFGKADFYYKLYDTPAQGKTYLYPDTFYSVAVWPDYGYWVTRMSHRVPTANPGSYSIYAGDYEIANQVARYFTSTDEMARIGYMKKWQAKYVIVDSRIASPNDKFYALARLSDKQESDFYELCWQKKDGKYSPLLVFYPEFYNSTVIRLYNFDGKQVVPQSTLIMAYQDQVTADGQKFKEITGFKTFNSYADAESFISSQKQGQYRIIGTDPLSSPVPLEQLAGYKPVYQSEQKASSGSTPLPAIKIFEYTQSAN
ncbi:MAG: oligosaccharyl transferase, archaeosortase A system-associated [Chloroflexi bacterium]|nr:oligosaccharyl transferase, archaeosortase A system-associated [Chloroflexota bacterium]